MKNNRWQFVFPLSFPRHELRETFSIERETNIVVFSLSLSLSLSGDFFLDMQLRQDRYTNTVLMFAIQQLATC